MPFKLEMPTVLERVVVPDNQYGDVASRLYWIDKKHHDKAVRLVFRTGAGEYWGIEETNMPNPPVLADKSFQRAIKGRSSSSTTAARTCRWSCSASTTRATGS